MNSVLRATAALALSVAAVGITAAQSDAFSARAYAEQECNARIQRGFTANNQAAFNACVRQQTQLIAPLANSPGARGFCAGVEETIQGDPEVRNNPTMAALVRQSLGC